MEDFQTMTSFEEAMDCGRGRVIRFELVRVHGSPQPTLCQGNSVWTPEVDLYETLDELVIEVNLSGVETKRIKMECSHRQVHISGERHEFENVPRRFHVMEIQRGHFERSIPLPSAVNVQNVVTNFRDGVLIIRLRKRRESLFSEGIRAGNFKDFK